MEKKYKTSTVKRVLPLFRGLKEIVELVMCYSFTAEAIKNNMQKINLDISSPSRCQETVLVVEYYKHDSHQLTIPN